MKFIDHNGTRTILLNSYMLSDHMLVITDGIAGVTINVLPDAEAYSLFSKIEQAVTEANRDQILRRVTTSYPCIGETCRFCTHPQQVGLIASYQCIIVEKGNHLSFHREDCYWAELNKEFISRRP